MIRYSGDTVPRLQLVGKGGRWAREIQVHLLLFHLDTVLPLETFIQ